MALFTIFLILLPYPMRIDIRRDFNTYIRKGVDYIRAGNYSAAEDYLEKAISSSRGKSDVKTCFFYLGVVKMKQRDWSGSLAYFLRYLGLTDSRADSIRAEPYILYTYYMDKRVYQGLNIIRKINSLSPEERIYLGLFYIASGMADSAATILEPIKRDEAYYSLAYIYYQKDMLSKAFQYLKKIKRKTYMVNLFMAYILYKQKDYKNAYAILKKLGINDNFSLTLMAFVEYYLDIPDISVTVNSQGKFMLEKGNYQELLYLLSKYYYRHKDFKKCILTIDKMDRAGNNKEKEIAFMYAASHTSLMRYSIALKEWKKYFQRFNWRIDDAYFHAGRCAFALGLYNLASSYLLKVDTYSPYYLWANYLLGRIFIVKGLDNEASIIFLKILDYKPVKALKARIYPFISDFFLSQKDYNRALVFYSELEKVIKDSVKLDSVRYNIEFCNYKLGVYQNPVQLNLTYVKKYPESHLSPELLYEAYLYYKSVKQADSMLYILSRELSMYQNDKRTVLSFKNFVENYMDSTNISEIYDSVMNLHDYDLKLYFGKRLAKTGDYNRAIDLLQGIDSVWERDALCELGTIYYKIGSKNESMDILQKTFPPFDTTGVLGAMVYVKELLEEGMIDSLYNMIDNNTVPDSVKIALLDMSSNYMRSCGDSLTAKEFLIKEQEIQKKRSDDME